MTADTDRTSELPTAKRRRGPWLVGLPLAAVVVAALGYAIGADGRGPRVAAGSEAPATTAPPASSTTTDLRPVVTTTTTTAPERLTAGSRLSLDGLGPVDIGMTLEQASAAAGTPIRTRPDDGFGPECQYAFTADVPEVAFMVIDGRIARIDVGFRSGRRVTTVSGIGKGDTEAAVQRTYPGRIRVQGHPYLPTGRYLVYVPADPALAHLSLIFETDGQVVTSFRAGMKGAVAQIEGCS